MPKYKVLITETLEAIIDVEADDAFDAMSQVADKRRNCEIILDAENLTDYNISIYKEDK